MNSNPQRVQALLIELSQLIYDDKKTPMFTPGDSKTNNQLKDQIQTKNTTSTQKNDCNSQISSSQKQNRVDLNSNQNYNQDLENVIKNLNGSENEQNLRKSLIFNQTAYILEQFKKTMDGVSSNRNTITEQSETLSKNRIDHNIKQENDFENLLQKMLLNTSFGSKKHTDANRIKIRSQEKKSKNPIKLIKKKSLQNPQINNFITKDQIENVQNKNLFNLDGNALSFNLLHEIPNNQNDQDELNEKNTSFENNQNYFDYQNKQRKKLRKNNDLPSTQIHSLEMAPIQENQGMEVYDIENKNEQRKSMLHEAYRESSLSSSSACNQPLTRRTYVGQNNQFMNVNNQSSNYQSGGDNDEISGQNMVKNALGQSQFSQITSPSYQSVNYFNDLPGNCLSNRARDGLKTKIVQGFQNEIQDQRRQCRNQGFTMNDMTLGAQTRGAQNYNEKNQQQTQYDEYDKNELGTNTQCIVGGEVVFYDNHQTMKTSPDFKDIILNTGSSEDHYKFQQNLSPKFKQQKLKKQAKNKLKQQLQQLHQPTTPFQITYNSQGLPIACIDQNKNSQRNERIMLPYATLCSQPEYQGSDIIQQFQKNNYLFEQAQNQIKMFHQNIQQVQNRLQKISGTAK